LKTYYRNTCLAQINVIVLYRKYNKQREFPLTLFNCLQKNKRKKSNFRLTYTINNRQSIMQTFIVYVLVFESVTDMVNVFPQRSEHNPNSTQP